MLKFGSGSVYSSAASLYAMKLTFVVSPQEIPPNEGAFPAERIIVGGDSNRWLNISQTVIIQGAEDSDSKIFMCEVCVDRSSPDIVCHTANYTSWTIGAPPIIINGSSTSKLTG